MRGAGKTTTGGWASRILGWPLLDLDAALESHAGVSIPDLIKTHGWDAFRAQELQLLQNTLLEKRYGHVLACGGGIVETPAARALLAAHAAAGGLVLLVSRDMHAVMTYLNIDKTRPAYVDDLAGVWERRRPWYRECSNLQFHSAGGLAGSQEEFERFLKLVTGRRAVLDDIVKRPYSFFVCLTFPDVKPHVELLQEVVVGSDAVELRVDLLRDPAAEDGICGVDYLIEQTAILRAAVSQPLIFTLRTVSQGGKFPDKNHEHALELYRTALRLGFDFIDLEITSPETLLDEVSAKKGYSKIIASHHDPKGHLSWADGSWTAHYNQALQHGDVIKLVGVAKTYHDNLSLAEFRQWATSSHPVPLIAINMGELGKVSRIDNLFMTPVMHPKLPSASAPGQLSAAQIRQGLHLHGLLPKKQFYIFGNPIAHSRSPALHNTLFAAAGLPHEYSLFETEAVDEPVKRLIRAPDFGGASVTIPFKRDMQDCMDELGPDVEVIGAMNTIVVEPHASGSGSRLIGRNTDWQGMVRVLRDAGADPHIAGGGKHSALVVGGGGTARAAIFALHSMGYAPIALVGRDAEKMRTLATAFPASYNVHVIEDSTSNQVEPAVVIGCIPADQPIEGSGTRSALRRLRGGL